MGKPNKPKFYVVWKGHQPGVYANWDAASRQVSGFPGAEFKSFPSRQEAETAFAGAYASYAGQNTKSPKRSLEDLQRLGVILDSIVVDAACSGVPGPMEYRGVSLRDGQQLFHQGPFPDGTNNVGEFLALVHALAWLKQQNRPGIPIYSDSRNAQLWIKAKACRTKLEHTGRNDAIFEMIDRAENWLAANAVTNPIIKWKTDEWGEIPADFGRK